MTERVRIDKLVYGGDGLGRLASGEVVFVPWSAPQDELDVLPRRGEKPLKGEIENILQASPLRVEAPCSVFGICGGCQWQHLSSAEQRGWKREIVKESLQRIGKFQDIDVRETLGSDETAWHYRNRVQWMVSHEAHTVALGYHQADSHRIVAFDHCWIIPENLTPLAHWLKNHLSEYAAGYLKRIEVQENQAGDILLELEGVESFTGDEILQLEMTAQQCVEAFPQIKGLVFRSGKFSKTIWGEPHLLYHLGGHPYQVTAGSFFQTNLQAAEAILDLLSEWLHPETRSLLDVYAGVGTFAVHLNNRASRILAIESSRTAITDAFENIRLNNAPHIEIRDGDARHVLKRLEEEFDAIILDPPRSGCHADVLDWACEQIRNQILYVSCNPTTLARDLKHLCGKGWRIETVQPVDMFPQTYHIETLVRLARS